MTDDNEWEFVETVGEKHFFLRVFVRKTRLELWNEVGDPSESKKQSSRGLTVGECVWVNLERHQIGRIEQNARDMLKKSVYLDNRIALLGHATSIKGGKTSPFFWPFKKQQQQQQSLQPIYMKRGVNWFTAYRRLCFCGALARTRP